MLKVMLTSEIGLGTTHFWFGQLLQMQVELSQSGIWVHHTIPHCSLVGRGW